MSELILAVTGHRPPKIGGYDPSSPLRQAVRAALREQLISLAPAEAVSGFALGVDQDFAAEALALGIRLVAAIPFKGQESRWPAEAQTAYHALLKRAAEVHYICPPGYAAWKMQRRNEWMVDRCGRLLAVWDGTSGGTANCVRYAAEQQRLITRIDPHACRT